VTDAGLRPNPVGLWDIAAGLLEELDDDAAVVAATIPGSWLHRALAASVHPARLFRYAAEGAPGMFAGPGLAQPRLVLGEADRDVPDPAPLPWPLAKPPPARRIRALDTVVSPAHTVGVLIVEATEAIDRVIAGASRLIERDAPTVVVGWGGLPRAAHPALWRRLVERLGRDYRWFDGTGRPCGDAAAHAPALTEGASLASVGVRATAGWAPRPRARLDRVIVPADQDLPCAGLYDTETDGGSVWRWSGPGRNVAIAAPLPGPGRWRLWLDILSWASANDARDLTVFADGQRLEPVDTPGRGATYADFRPADAPPLVRIDIVTPPPRRASPDDPRMIGINLTRIGLFRVGSDIAVEHATGIT